MKLIKLLPIVFLVFFSCTGNKFDYSTAYKFKVKSKTYNNQKAVNTVSTTENAEISESLSASKKTEIIENIEGSIAMATETPNLVQSELKTKKQERLERRFNKIKKKIERRIEKKASPKTIAINSKIYIGGVIFLGGLVLIILGGVLGTIGSLAALVGVILVVWGLLEQA